jgi:hypothetical protein
MLPVATLLTPKEAAREIWGSDDESTTRRVYRWLKKGNFDEIAAAAGTVIIKDGDRYHIPMAVVKAMRGDK